MARTLTPQAVKILRRVKRHILEEPRRIAMKHWCVCKSGLRYFSLKAPKCGTVACVGGWVEMLHGARTASPGNPLFSSDLWGQDARSILGLSSRQACDLFYPSDLVNASDQQSPTHAKAVAEHIDRFIAKYGPKRKAKKAPPKRAARGKRWR